jgi:hypothetical protein
MKISLLLLFFSLSFTQIIAQSSVILPNGNVIPSFTLANRPSTNPLVGQLIYQTDGTSGLYVWNGTAWVAVSNGSGTSGTVTSVTTSAPLSVTNGTTAPALSISQANGSTNGFLSSADWNIFNNKQNALPNANSSTNGILASSDWTTFNNKQNLLPQANSTTNGFLSSADWNTFNNKFALPSLTDGSILFSNGTTISQNNSSFKWNEANRRLEVKGFNNGLVADGFNNWISAAIGGSGGNRVVIGVQNGEATIGAHNETLNGWTKLVVNPAGTTSIGSLTGVGTRMVVANASGELNTLPIPTLTSVTAASPLSVTNTTTTPVVSIPQASSSQNGFLGSSDWITFNNKQNVLSNANASTSGILTSTDWTIFNNKFNLPSLTEGSILFSNGTTINQSNLKFFWDNTNNRLGIGVNTPSKTLDVSGTGGLRVNSTNGGSGQTDWIAADFGGTAGNRVVLGNLNGESTLAAHNNSLSNWAKLVINPGGATTIGSTDATKGVKIDNNGSLGIGIETPSGLIDVYSSTPTYGGTYYEAANPDPYSGETAVYYTGREPMDGNSATFWLARIIPCNFLIDYPTPKKLRMYRLVCNVNVSGQARMQSWTLEGSNDQNNWVILDRQVDVVSANKYIPLSYNENAFRYYRINITKSSNPLNAGDIYAPRIDELNLLEENVVNSGAFIVKNNGNVGIGTANPLTKLDVNGSIRLSAGASNGAILVSDANGHASWSATPTINAVSLTATNVTASSSVNAASIGVGTTSTVTNKATISGTGGIKVNSTNTGTGTSDWIASNVGGTSGDRVVSGILNGTATIGGHNSALNSWSHLVINPAGGGNSTVTIGSDNNLSPTAGDASSSLDRKVTVNGSIRQGYYSVPITVSSYNATYVTWNHNLGYGPIVMMSTDQNGGGAYMDYCTYTTYNNSANQTVFVIRNMGSNNASGTFRWILVW